MTAPGSWIALTAVLLGAGCSLVGKSVTYDYFVLTPRPPSAGAPGAEHEETVRTPLLAIGAVTLPDYLGREAVVTRLGPHQVMYSRHDRWAEPLEEAFERTLRHDLAARLEPGIVVGRQRVAAAPALTLLVDVVRFERSGEREVELWARWSLFSNGSLREVGETRARGAMARPNSAAMAAALSVLVDQLGADVSTAVQNLASAKARPGSAPVAGSID